MKIPQKINELRIGGNVASVDIRNGAHGQFGSCVIAVDDGYFKKGDNGQNGQWIDRTYFHPVALKTSVIKKLAGLNQGDFVVFTGKLVEEKWKDKNSGQDRKVTKMEANDVELHIDAQTAKQLRQAARDNKNNNQNGGNGGYQQGGNGGYQQGGNGGYQQGGNGGYNQNQNSGYQQQGNGGGYQQQNQQPMNGYSHNGQQPMGGYQQQGNGGYQQHN